jgi:protoporphyrin/coproporphyrin ferrochelatase
MATYDAFLLISFGGPEKPADVIPFLENVLRGKNVPRDRLEVVADHYYHFGGRSPINDQNKALIVALKAALTASGLELPIYWGNRNWEPLLEDTLRQMAADGVKLALALATSAFGSYSGCRQYIEDIDRARAAVGEGAPALDKIPPFSGNPGFIAAQVDRVHEAIARFPSEVDEARRNNALLYFTAHSIPRTMADSSPYLDQLTAACRRVAAELGRSQYRLVYQSRSGPPGQPWLEPDISDALREDHAAGARDAIVVPIGFLSDHMEVIYDLDVLARDTCAELGMNMVRAGTVETHPLFVAGIVDMVRAYGTGERPPVCAPDCCPMARRPSRP